MTASPIVAGKDHSWQETLLKRQIPLLSSRFSFIGALLCRSNWFSGERGGKRYFEDNWRWFEAHRLSLGNDSFHQMHSEQAFSERWPFKCWQGSRDHCSFDQSCLAKKKKKKCLQAHVGEEGRTIQAVLIEHLEKLCVQCHQEVFASKQPRDTKWQTLVLQTAHHARLF